VRFGAGMFVHTFNVLIPPDQYFDAHPEYFSLVKGERKKDHSQLCCTNEDVIRICTEETLKRIRQDPTAFVFSVSQNDWHNYCECDKCTALADAEGSQMAPVLQLVNRVADTVETEFPDKAIETLAYQYTRKACKTMRPRDNVIIRLCSIECCFMHPLDTCDMKANRAFREDTEEWAKVADRLWVWDYVTSFRDYLCPYPNLRVRDDNIRFFIKNNVTGIFEQDVYNTFGGELSALSGYLNAKLLWDQNYCEDKAINEFLENVYGDAAKPIRKYLDMLHNHAEKKNIHANIWVTSMSAPFLNDKLVEKSKVLWDEATAAVADQPAVLDRVKVARLAVDHAWMERARANADSAYIAKHDEFRIEPRAEFKEQVVEFFKVARQAKVSLLDEHRMSLDKYESGFKDILDAKAQTFTPLDPVTPPSTEPGLSCAFYQGEWTALPDFKSLKSARESVVGRIGLAPGKDAEAYGLDFTGYIHAKRDGVYHFSLSSNDGSRLTVGSRVLVDNDGSHSMVTKSAAVGLRAGWHLIRLEYFQAGGDEGLELTWAGPGFGKQMIPKKALRQNK
jgi:uncharacterized protein DUF4838/PA14 domain-containing protein